MAYIIQDSTLTGIADAIRAKDGTTDKIKVSDMAAKIGTIKTGGGEDKSEAIIARSITKYSNDNIKKIGNYAFYNCGSLASVNLPSATDIGMYAFDSCYHLTSVDFPSATNIGMDAFDSCYALASAHFPSATDIGMNAFHGCQQLASVDFPSATNIGGSAFYGCSFALASVEFPSATGIGSDAFMNCYALASADFLSATNIEYRAFLSCTKLTNLILRSGVMCSLGDTNAFANTPIESGAGYIYVPKALLDSYKTATNWSKYAAQFRALEDYTVDGTTTGELDTTKI